MKSLERLLRISLRPLERLCDFGFGAANNPVRQAGTVGIYFLWVCVLSGIYVYIFFDTSVAGAYGSLETLEREQWWFGGVMRSLHRYSSDGLVLFMGLHILRELSLGRYTGARWFSWLTGTPVLWLLILAGITGYWLVWDERAQYVALVSAEWLDQVAVFGGRIARNFLPPDGLGDRFFTLLMFLHIAFPLFLLFGLWIHLQRISRAKINVTRRLFAGMSAVMLVLSVLQPALSEPPANLAMAPGTVDIDWYYLAFYPLLDGQWQGMVWWLASAFTLAFVIVPWLPRRKRPPVAQVHLDFCNGCRRCVDDCPYNAVAMVPRSDGKPFAAEAEVNPDKCVACGLCFGACPPSSPFRRLSGLTTGIELPDLSLEELTRRTRDVAEGLAGESRVLVYRCAQAPEAVKEDGATASITLPCLGMLPPAFLDFVLSRGLADGVLLSGCSGGDCFHRFGRDWTEQRIARARDPQLRTRVPRERILLTPGRDVPPASVAEGLAMLRLEIAAEEDADVG